MGDLPKIGQKPYLWGIIRIYFRSLKLFQTVNYSMNEMQITQKKKNICGRHFQTGKGNNKINHVKNIGFVLPIKMM